MAGNSVYQQAVAKYMKPATKEVLEKTKKALEEKGHSVSIVSSKKSALSTLQSLIPDQSSINLTGSTSLSEIGFVDYLMTTDRWNNLKAKVLSEKDPEKQKELRRLATTSDYAISTVDAVTEDGQFVVVDASGTRVVVVHAASKVIFVVGSQKLVKDLDTAFDRVHNISYPTESARVRVVYPGAAGSTLANTFVGKTSLPYNKGKFHFLIVEENVGF